MRKKTHEEFMKDFEEKQPELFARVEVLGKYVNSKTKIKCKCKKCSYEWNITPGNLLSNGHGCPSCAGNPRYGEEGFIKRLGLVNPNIKLIGAYTNARTATEFECLIDNYKWKATPDSLLRGHNCPKCVNRERYTTESFKEKLKEINPNIEVVGKYTNTKTKIKCRCLIDGYEWEATPASLLRGHNCPKCVNRERYTTESFKEKLKEINPNIEILGEYISSDTKIKCKCLIDGNIWDSRPDNLSSGYGCPKCAHTQTSWLQEKITSYFSKKYPLTRSRDTLIIGMELDIVIPELKLAIEPGGWHWHYEVADKRDRDVEKRRLCAEKGYTCITIYDGCDNPELVPFKDEDTCLIYEDDIGIHKYLLDDVLDSIEDIIKTR